MARQPPAFKEADITRVVRGATKAGVKVARVELESGKITVFAADVDAKTPATALEDWIARRGSR